MEEETGIEVEAVQEEIEEGRPETEHAQVKKFKRGMSGQKWRHLMRRPKPVKR